MNKGSLYVVATPIGNLDDITLRAINILKSVDFIVCEDTRLTKILLDKYKIKKELTSLNARNEVNRIDYLIDKLDSSYSFALVSDAGTPSISDPGVRLINAAIEKGLKVIGIPGANAAILALSVSGLPTDSFIFEGFLPQKKGRQKKLKELSLEARTIILYESLYRIEKLLNELNEYMPNRYVSVHRELTKMFEEMWRGYPEDIIQMLPQKTIKGEFVVIIAPLNWKQQ